MPIIDKKIALLGSTGSIGTSTCQVVTEHADCLSIFALAAYGSNPQQLIKQIKQHRVQHVAVYDEGVVDIIRQQVDSSVNIYTGLAGLCTIATLPEVDIVLTAIVGTMGLQPSLQAIEHGKDLAIASKEILVVAGHLIMPKAKQHKVRILPVDSEHSAIFQCLQGYQQQPNSVAKIVLTASGGAFRDWDYATIKKATVADALKHPTWQMGQKITIDSATLFNKALEMIEACWLFDIAIEDIEVVVHRQSIIHSMVQYRDGNTLAQCSYPDMCSPIQLALLYPEKKVSSLERVDFVKLGALTFEVPREDVFPALQLARQAYHMAGTAPTVFNAANEAAVELFIAGKITFCTIAEIVAKALAKHTAVPEPDLATIVALDQQVKTAILTAYASRD